MSIRRISVTITALTLMLLGVLPSSAQGTSQIRFVHAIPNASPVDVYINGRLAIVDLSFGTATTYFSAPAGEHALVVTPTGIAAPLWQQNISIGPEQTTTFIAADSNDLKFNAYVDNLAPLAFGDARWSLYHAIAGAPEVSVELARDVTIRGTRQSAGTIIGTMGFGQVIGAFDLPAQVYTVNLVSDGTSIVESLPLSFNAGESSIGLVYGTPSASRFTIISAPSRPGGAAGFVRFVHAATNAPAVDLLVNDTVILPAFAPGSASQHLALPAGDHVVSVRVSGETDEALSVDLTVSEGQAQTIVVRQDDQALLADSFVDDLSDVSTTQAVVGVINAASGILIQEVRFNGVVLANNLQTGQNTTTPLSPGDAVPAATLNIGGQIGTIQGDFTPLYGGVYYNMILLPSSGFSAPRLLIAATSLSQEIASAPRTNVVLQVPAVVPPTATPTAPVAQPPAPVVQPPAVVPGPDAPEFTARIVLNPGANLQLRQYPSRDALSLGLAPSGSTLIVNGREGAPVALVEGQTPPPEADTWVDPVTNLVGDEDLNPADTWLNVVYNTPDGGTITAWVNAQFLDVRNRRNRPQRLAELPTVGGNIPGESVGTSIRPPVATISNVTVTVVNLAAGANLNVRRLPDITSEVLASLPGGTVADFIGNSEDDSWVYLEYTSPDGGTVTGWASRQFLEYRVNGTRIELEALKNAVDRTTRSPLFATVPSDQIGVASGPIRAVPVATANPVRNQFVATVVLDPTANLQLRRFPDATSQSLALIPSGSQLIVLSRTEAADWLLVTYEGQEGWISSQFVTVRFNDRIVPVTDISVDPLLGD
ncbi:MAG: DUF4397 domain-containing protein [Anaerolineae bacterium]|nr:DUF4397 domain-containing protein [Anaerolineae bacterium]MDW8173209.1 DUF4397 domain-containing protein [Anaerolineae bacterium]